MQMPHVDSHKPHLFADRTQAKQAAGAVQEKAAQASTAVTDTAAGAKDTITGKTEEAMPDKSIGDQAKDSSA